MKELVRRAGRAALFDITSRAVSDDETGNGIYPPAQRTLREHGIPFGDHAARKVTPAEYAAADLVLVMDTSNRARLQRIIGFDQDRKVHLLMEYAGTPRSIADPWYTGDFETAYADILAGCTALLDNLD